MTARRSPPTKGESYRASAATPHARRRSDVIDTPARAVSRHGPANGIPLGKVIEPLSEPVGTARPKGVVRMEASISSDKTIARSNLPDV